MKLTLECTCGNELVKVAKEDITDGLVECGCGSKFAYTVTPLESP